MFFRAAERIMSDREINAHDAVAPNRGTLNKQKMLKR